MFVAGEKIVDIMLETLVRKCMKNRTPVYQNPTQRSYLLESSKKNLMGAKVIREKRGQRQLWDSNWGFDHCQASLFVFLLCFSLFVGLIVSYRKSDFPHESEQSPA